MAGGDYGRIRHTFWTDPDIKRGLNLEQKALLLYFFTSPHSSLVGLYYCPLEYISVETGIPVERVREATTGPLSRYVTYDEVTEEVFVHRAGRHQVGDDLKGNDKRVKSIQKVVAETHSPRLVAKFLEMYAHWPLNMEAPTVPPEPEQKPLPSPSEAKAVNSAVQLQSSAVAEPLRDEPTAGSSDALRLKVDLEHHADENGYGPTDRLIAIGEDISAWRMNDGMLVPMVDRIRCLTLADAHLKKPGSKAHDLRSALRYVIVQQFDPFTIQRAADRPARVPEPERSQPPPAVDQMALLRAENPAVFAEALAEFERLPWWSKVNDDERLRQMKGDIRERLSRPRIVA